MLLPRTRIKQTGNGKNNRNIERQAKVTTFSAGYISAAKHVHSRQLILWLRMYRLRYAG